MTPDRRPPIRTRSGPIDCERGCERPSSPRASAWSSCDGAVTFVDATSAYASASANVSRDASPQLGACGYERPSCPPPRALRSFACLRDAPFGANVERISCAACPTAWPFAHACDVVLEQPYAPRRAALPSFVPWSSRPCERAAWRLVSKSLLLPQRLLLERMSAVSIPVLRKAKLERGSLSTHRVFFYPFGLAFGFFSAFSRQRRCRSWSGSSRRCSRSLALGSRCGSPGGSKLPHRAL